MSIYGIGTDITETARIGRMIEQHGEQFLFRVYTPDEIKYCQYRRHATIHFAGRWAAKEAVLKSMGTGWSRGIAWTDVEVRNAPGGRPDVLLHGAAREIAAERGITAILLSISHCRSYATAYAIAVMGPRPQPAIEPEPAPDLFPQDPDETNGLGNIF